MPELPKVSQDFTADTSGYIAGIDAMIAAADEFLRKNAEMITAIEALKEELDSIPREITVSIRYVTSGEIPTVRGATQVIRQQVIPAEGGWRGGATGGFPSGMDVGQMQAAANAMRNEMAAANDARQATAAYDASLERAMADAKLDNEFINQLTRAYGANSVATKNMTAAQAELLNTVLDELAASKNYKDNVDGLTVQLGIAGQIAKQTAAGYNDVVKSMAAGENTSAGWLKGMSEAAAGQKKVQEATVLVNEALAQNAIANIYASGAEAAGSKNVNAMAAALTQAGVAGKILASGQNEVAAGGNAVATSGFAAALGWGFFTTKIQLWGGLMPGVLGHIRGWHIALDALVEGFIAVAGALLAFTVGAVAVTPAVTDIKDHLTSVYDVSHALGQSIPPITGQFTQLAHALAPQVLVIYGAALNVIQRQTGVLGTTAHNVVNIFENWAIKFQLWSASQNNLGKILASGTGFLSQFGQILGNVGAAISNLVKADPGTAHFLLDFFVGATRVLDAVTKLPSPILYAALAFHSIWLWGGLAANGIIGLLAPLKAVALALGGLDATKIGANASGLEKLKTTVTDIGLGFASLGKNIATWVRGIGTAMKDAEGFTATAAAGMNAAFGPLLVTLKGLAANPITWIVALAVGLGALVYSATQADGATKGLINSINGGLSSMTASQAIFGGLSSDFSQLHTQLNQVNAAWAASTPGISKLGGTWSQAFAAAKHSVDELGHAFGLIGPTANPSLNAITAEITHLTTAQSNLFNTVGYTMKQNGYTFEQTVALMDLAGVKAGDTFLQMKTKVDDLVKGFQNMGVQGPLLASAVNAITFATTLADSKVSAITQGFSQFLSVLTGGETTMLTFATGMLGLAQAATNGTTAIRTTNGVTRLTTTALSAAAAQASSTGASMSGLGTNSIALRQAFEQQITAAGNAINSMYTLSAAGAQGKTGLADITQGAKDYVAALVPFAQGNQAAVVQLMGVAQMAGGPAYSATKTLAQNFQTLTTWVGNVQNPLAQADSIMTKMTTAAGNLAQDVLNLAAAINTNLNTAMANAVTQAGGGQKAFDNFATAVLNTHGNLQALIPSATGVYNVLVQALGKGVPQVEQTFKAFAEGGLHLSIDDTNALWKMITGNLVPGLGSAGKAADNLKTGHLDPLQTALDGVKGHTQSLAGETGKNLPSAMAAAGKAMDTTKSPHAAELQTAIDGVKSHTQSLAGEAGQTLPSALAGAGKAMDTTKSPHASGLQTAIDGVKSHTQSLAGMAGQTLPQAMSVAQGSMTTTGGKATTTGQTLTQTLLKVLQDLDKWVGIMATDFTNRWPKNESTNVKVSGSGGAGVKSNVSGVPNGIVTVYGFAGGGVMPGYAPGVDTIHAMLSPGEGVLIPQATKMLGGEAGIHSINKAAQHFATGGVATPNVFGWAGKTLNLATKSIDDAFAKVLESSVAGVEKATQNSMTAAANALAAKYAGQGGSNQQNIALGSKMAGAYGWSGLQFLDLAALWTRESGWSSIAQNPSSGAAGIAQNISGFSGGYQRGNAAQQIAWGLSYIKGRYGSPAAAWAHEVAFNWYDQGGMLPPGLSIAMNGTGKPEPVGNPGGPMQGEIHVHTHVGAAEVAHEIFPMMKAESFRYGTRNSGSANGVWKPGVVPSSGRR